MIYFAIFLYCGVLNFCNKSKTDFWKLSDVFSIPWLFCVTSGWFGVNTGVVVDGVVVVPTSACCFVAEKDAEVLWVDGMKGDEGDTDDEEDLLGIEHGVAVIFDDDDDDDETR